MLLFVHSCGCVTAHSRDAVACTHEWHAATQTLHVPASRHPHAAHGTRIRAWSEPGHAGGRLQRVMLTRVCASHERWSTLRPCARLRADARRPVASQRVQNFITNRSRSSRCARPSRCSARVSTRVVCLLGRRKGRDGTRHQRIPSILSICPCPYRGGCSGSPSCGRGTCTQCASPRCRHAIP